MEGRNRKSVMAKILINISECPSTSLLCSRQKKIVKLSSFWFFVVTLVFFDLMGTADLPKCFHDLGPAIIGLAEDIQWQFTISTCIGMWSSLIVFSSVATASTSIATDCYNMLFCTYLARSHKKLPLRQSTIKNWWNASDRISQVSIPVLSPR